MHITNLPRLDMISKRPFWAGWQLRNPDETPISLDGFSGTCVFSRNLVQLLSVPVSIDADSNVEISLTPEEVADLMGPGVVYEITITSNIDPNSMPAEVWRGAVNVQ